MSYEAVPWIGASEFAYVFHVYRSDELIPSRPGLFIYCKRDGHGIWHPIYIGQGDLSVCCDDASLLACIGQNGATHIHMRLCNSIDDRIEELADLLKRYRNAYAPHGCNREVA